MIPKKIFGIAALGATALSLSLNASAAQFDPVVVTPTCAPAGCAVSQPSPPLSLADAVQMALRSHPDTRASAARLEGMHALEGQARAGAAPQLSGSLVTSTSKLGDAAATDSAQAQLRLSYVLFDFGKRKADIDAARSNSLAAELDTEAAAQAVILATVEKYFTHVEALETAAAARASVESAKVSLAAAQTRFDTGLASRLELLQAQSLLASSELAELRAQAGGSVAEAALAQQLGLRSNARVEVAKLPEPSAVDLPPLDALMTQAKSQRPEATAARRRLDAAAAQRRSAQALGKPTLSVSATGGRTSYFGNGLSNQSGIGVTLDIPLFDGGMSKNQRAYARAQESLAEANLDSQLRTVELAVVQAHAQMATSQSAYRSAQAFLQAASQAQDQAQGRYVAGVGSMTDWLDTQAKLASARQQHIAALLDWHDAKLALARAVGSLSLSSI
jgi:outer membrane protein